MEVKNFKFNDECFMSIAEVVSLYSTCRRQVGALIVKDDTILTKGYNDAPNGLAKCVELGGCMRQRNGIPSGTRQEYCRAVHAEQNAIIEAATKGIVITSGTLYVTTYPCSICARMIINCKLERIVYKGDYKDENSHKMLSESGILIEKFEPVKRKVIVIGN